MVGNNAICYEAIQRILRNSIVDYLRLRLPETFSDDHIEKLKKPFEKEWSSLVLNAEACRATGGTATKIRDEYDLLSVGHFFNIFDAYFDKLFATSILLQGKYKKPGKAKFLGNLKAIKDVRDPLSHPVEEEISFEEAFGLLIDAKQVLSSLGLEDQARAISDLMQRLQGLDAQEEGKLVCSLPTQDSIYLDFVGRSEVLQSLGQWFANPSNKRCLLAGDGGKGKSAVAYRFAQRLSGATDDYRLIAWLSAKRRRFEEGKVVAINEPDFSDLDSAVDRMLLHYGIIASEDKSLEQKKTILMQLLNDFPAFLVVDDIDTILTDTEAVGLFTFDIPATKSTVLLTSRRDIPGVKSLTIRGFEISEVGDFVKSRVELYGLDSSAFHPGVYEKLWQATDGSPLYMDDLLRLAHIVSVEKAIDLWTERKGDEARKYALQRELEQLSTDARRVLIAASIGDHPISFPEIESIVKISEDRIMSALAELQTLFLVPKPRIVEGEQRFELNSNTRKLVRLVEERTDQYARIEANSKAIQGTLRRVGNGVVSALIRQALLLVNSGRGPQAESLMLNAIDKYPQEADLQGFLGFVYRRMDRFTDAAKHFNAAYQLKCTTRDAYRHWVKMEMYLGEWTRAIAAADKGIRMIPGFYELHAFRAQCKLRSGQDFARRLQREKAFKLWSEAAAELKVALKAPDKLQSGEREISAEMYRVMIICLDLMGDFKGLYAAFQNWRNEHPDDSNVEKQREFIEGKRGRSLAELASIRQEPITTSHPRPF
jgi:tetratricopeptide (TPR) repeat protein